MLEPTVNNGHGQSGHRYESGSSGLRERIRRDFIRRASGRNVYIGNVYIGNVYIGNACSGNIRVRTDSCDQHRLETARD